MPQKPPLKAVFQSLLKAYGPQHWWPGDTSFEVMVGAVLTQNTAWINVERAIANLVDAGLLDPQRIVSVRKSQLAAQLRPSGYFNIKAERLRSLCRWYLEQGGLDALSEWTTTDLRHSLLAVHGVGPETADDILLYAFDRPVFVIDTYTRRIFSRLGLIQGDETYEYLRGWFEQVLGEDVALFNEYHALIVRHAKAHCRTKQVCAGCCLRRRCKGKIV